MVFAKEKESNQNFFSVFAKKFNLSASKNKKPEIPKPPVQMSKISSLLANKMISSLDQQP